MIRHNIIENAKVAIIYDRVNKFGGAERVLLALNEMFPDAPLYTSVYSPENAKWAKVFPKVFTSFLQKFSFIRKHHELFGWLMPVAFESFNFSNYDLVISVTSEAAKGIITDTKTLHVCYCLTPTRYLWSGRKFYINNPPEKFKLFPFFKFISLPFMSYLENWDKVACYRPDFYLSISNEVKTRVSKYYGRDSDVIYPPVSLKNKSSEIVYKQKDYYLMVGRFEPYKRLDLVVRVFNNLGLKLIVAGSGSEMAKQEKLSKGNIKFIHNPSDGELTSLYKNAKAFVFPQEEDFGITAVEAQSFGIPVIAFKKGGALDTVVEGKTGVFFDSQTEDSLKHAIANFDTISFNRTYIIEHAEIFSKERFKRELQRSLVRAYSSWRGRNPSLA